MKTHKFVPLLMTTKSPMKLLCGFCLSLLLLTNWLQPAHAQEESNPGTPNQKIFLPIIQSDDDKRDDVMAAFTHNTWRQGNLINVAANECGLWDDMPSAAANGNNDEAGLLWFLTNNSTDEKCSYSSDINDTQTDNAPLLRVRAAVNDGARFTVKVFERGVSEFCETPVSSITATAADSEFHSYQVSLPAHKTICLVQITLDDNPDNIASLRASALIDYVWLWNGVNNAGIIWFESFARPN